MGILNTGSKSKSKSGSPPPPPPPPPQASFSRNQGQQPKQTQSSQLPAGTIAVGVETEFLLGALEPDPNIRSIEDFSRKIAQGYVQSIAKLPPSTHPGMHNAINEAFHGARYSEWSLDKDSTIDVPSGHQLCMLRNKKYYYLSGNSLIGKGGLELISPILVVQSGSLWRSHITAVWSHLQRHYRISANSSCGTHVHMSVVGGYSLDDLKRIACAVLHFEPAFDALLPRARLANEYTKSNWIDNSNFAYKKMSRCASMDLVHKCQDLRALVLLMNPDRDGDRDKMFGWNFLNLLQSPKATIEFRRGAASTSVQDVFMWVEVAMSFLKVSMLVGSRDNLQKVPPNVGGLKWFMNAANLPPDVFDSTLLQSFLSQASDNASVQVEAVGRLSSEKAEKLKRKKLEDKNRNIMLAKTLNAPYWS